MKSLDTTKILKRIIIVSWIALACCFLIKLLGGNIFEIVCNNQRFIAICNYADNHLWAYFTLASFNCVLCSYFTILAMCGKFKFKTYELIIVIVSNVVGTFVKVYLNNYIGLVFDIINAFVIPCIFLIKTPKRIVWVFVGNVILFAFQSVSLLTRNLKFDFIDANSTLISLIFSVDVWIMCILYYLYSNLIKTKKER